MKRRKIDLWAIAVYFCDGHQFNAYGLFDNFRTQNRIFCLAKPFPDGQPTPDNAHAIDRLIAKCENMTTAQIDAITASITDDSRV